jgi:hypothetical protein
MDRAEAAGLGVSVAGHGALLAILSVALVTATRPPPVQQAMEVSFVDEIGLTSAAPQPSAAPAAAASAPEIGPTEDATPAPAAPAPPVVPRETAVSPSPRPAPPPRPAVRPAPAPAAATGQTTRRQRPLDLDPRSFGNDPAAARESPPAAVMSPQALASIVSAIQRQIQPCAGRRSNLLGPGAERIRVTLNLRLRADGGLAAAPTLLAGRATGVDDENRRYVQQVGDLIVAATRECSPLRGLPEELYRTPSGGWSNINVNFKFPDR